MAFRHILFVSVLLAGVPLPALAQDEDVECMDCHEDETLDKERRGLLISLFVDYSLYAASVHADEGCVSCHEDIEPGDLPHEDDLEKVDCSLCHDLSIDEFERSLHGISRRLGKYLAPTCATCHSKHAILESRDAESWTHESNISTLCGYCHKENLAVADLKPLSPREHRSLDTYEDAIHGDAGSRMGLTITPTCITCHSAHDVSSARALNAATDRAWIADTCLSCHGQIEEVHARVFEGPTWQISFDNGPICVDCHRTHERNWQVSSAAFADASCLTCHSDESIHRQENGTTRSLFVNTEPLALSVHGDLSCVSCHTNVSQWQHPVCIDGGPVNCATCHETPVAEYAESTHGASRAEGDENAPVCADCHGTHEILSGSNLQSPSYPANIPDLCGRCHREGEAAAIAYTGEQSEIVANYAMSIHGKGLVESGLVVTATCIDCHTPHGERPTSDPSSTINRERIGRTCAACHTGILAKFKDSVHSPSVTETRSQLPVCNDCHLSHEVSRVSEAEFQQAIMDQCGDCHEEVTERYYETFHGKASKLGSRDVARCYDCHGSHNILPTSHPESTLSRQNAVETCRQCHPRASVRFTQYLTHADYHDGERYPRLNFAFLSMTVLLISVFVFFGIHTLLWFPKAFSERKKNGRTNGNH